MTKSKKTPAKILKQITSILLIFTLIFTSLPTDAFKALAETAAESINAAAVNSPPETDTAAQIESELTEKRTEFQKHFRLTDGTYIAATYNEPVHYLENGTWQEIDNTLKQQSVDGQIYYVNTASSNKYMLPQTLGNNSIKIESRDGHTVTVAPVESNNNLGFNTELKAVNDLQTNKSLYREVAISDSNLSKMDLRNKTSGIRYSAIFDGADLEYTVTPSSLKESIVIKEKANRYSYSFSADFGGLVPVPLGNGAYGLFDKANLNADPIVLIEAPYMYDSNGEFSDDVTLNVTKNGNKYTLTVIPDLLWLNSSERQFPVVVDPTFKLDVGKSETYDTYVDTSHPSGSDAVLYGDSSLYVGMNSLGKTRTYIKYDLPTLPDCSVVTGASMVFQQAEFDSGSSSAAYIYAYDCGNNSWDRKTINWNNQPMSKTDLSGYTVLDYCQFKNNTGQYLTAYEFNVTKAAKNWYENGVNNGIMLASSHESMVKRARLFSSDYSGGAAYLPAIWVSYVNNTGIEDYWTYQTVDLGTSGAVYVGDYNGNMTYIHTDAATVGNRMPVSFSHIYSNDRTYFGGALGKMKFGKGFRPSMFECVSYVNGGANLGTTSNPIYQIKYIDSDGTVHFFSNNVSKTSQYKNELNDKITLTVKTNCFEMKDDSGNVKTFSKGGYLLKQTDANGNQMTVDYDSTGMRVTSITDGVGKKLLFAYNSSAYLTSVTDPAGRVTSYTYDGDYLKTITYPDGKTTNFTYSNEGGRLSEVVAYDSSTVSFTIKKVANSIFKVTSITKKSKLEAGSRTVENKLTYQYNSGETVVTDNFGKANYISFDNAGRTVNVRDNENNSTFSKYNNDGNKKNTLSVGSNTFASILNLAKNSSGEVSDSVWYQQVSGTGAAGSVEMSTSEHHTGAKSFKVISTGGAGRVDYCQALNIAVGKPYTLSAYLKINSEITGSGGACLGITYKVNSGAWKNIFSEGITDVQDWHRESYTFTLPEEATGSIGIMLVIYKGTGTAYFDSVQFEEGSAMNRYNLINNSGFEYVDSSNKPLYWSTSNAESKDGITNGLQGSKSYRFYGLPSTEKNIYQTVKINGNAGDTIVYGGWAKANSADMETKSKLRNFFCVTLTVIYADGTKEYTNQTFNRDVRTKQYVCSSFTAKKNYTDIYYYFTYYKDVNNAVFDSACMYIDNYGSSYSYNSDGRLEGVTDGTGQGMSYTYNGPDLTKMSQKFNGVEKESCTYTYDSKHNLLTETTKGGVVTAYEYGTDGVNTYGMPTKTTVKNSDGSLQSYSTMEYTTNYNFLTKVIDSKNGVTLYDYDQNSGQLNSTTDPKGNVTEYIYDEDSGELLTTTGSPDGETDISVDYGYVDYALTSITHNGFNYGFTYDKFGRRLSSTVADRTLITNSYNANGTLASAVYGNEIVKTFEYDSLDRVTAESYNGIRNYEYDYNKENLVYAVRDFETPDSGYIETKYDYDLARRLIGLTATDGQRVKYVYDERNNLKSMEMTVRGVKVANSNYTYKPDGLVNNATLPLLNNAVITYTHDALNRTTGKNIATGDNLNLATGYTYLANGANQTGLISGITHTAAGVNVANFSYSYDANGNITTVSLGGALNSSYTYDGLNQLIRYDDAGANKSYTYSYDGGGNITEKREYAYTTGELGEPTLVIPYTYDSQWKDLLTAYNGEGITYDQIGNPLSYRNRLTFTWKKGRQLATATDGITDIQYRYNSDGKRTKKIMGSETVEYFYSGNALVAQYDGTNWLKFIYSADGELVGFTENNTPYYYLKNLQGDVIGIYDQNLNKVVGYSYDSWGKLISITGSMADTLGIANPFRYRGYYYDTELGLYYLNSRYYDPEIGRFINADTSAILSVQDNLYDKNLFAYCDNNPTVRIDTGGAFWDTIFDVISLGASIIEVCVNPTDATAWLSLAGDTVDLIPFVSGVGETVRAVKIADNAAGVVDNAKSIYKAADKANTIRRSTGSYEIMYKSGNTYVGKGGFKRAINSASKTRKIDNVADEVASISWKPASNSRMAFINEYISMCKFGGPNNTVIKNKKSYNKIWSPGRNYYYQAGGKYYSYGGKPW